MESAVTTCSVFYHVAFTVWHSQVRNWWILHIIEKLWLYDAAFPIRDILADTLQACSSYQSAHQELAECLHVWQSFQTAKSYHEQSIALSWIVQHIIDMLAVKMSFVLFVRLG